MRDKTVKEIADELGVSKTAVMKKIDNLGLRFSLKKIANQLAIDAHSEALIKQCFDEKSPTKKSQTKSPTKTSSVRLDQHIIDMLQMELKSKNELIKAQQKTIDRLASTIEIYSQKELATKLIEGQKLNEQPQESNATEFKKQEKSVKKPSFLTLFQRSNK